MGKVFGKVTDAVGLTNYSGEEKARKMAANANEAAIELQRENIALQKEVLDFNKEQYNDWKEIYGDIQENLGEYYNNLDPDDFIARGLQNQQREYQNAIKSIETQAAQRGISGSGLETAEKFRSTFQNAERRAEIRSSGDEEVNQQKLAFLGIGLGQGASYLGGVNTSASNVNNAYGTAINSRNSFGSNFIKQNAQFSLQNQSTVNDLAGSAAGFFLPV